MTRELSVSSEMFPDMAELEIVQHGLDDYNVIYGAYPPATLGVFMRDTDGKVVGGAFGDLGWGWLYVDLMWVDPTRRRRHEGERLLTSLEQAALARGTARVYLATTSFQALPFYYYLGYRLFGVLEDRPPGYHYYYLSREITPRAGDWLPSVDYPPQADYEPLRQGLRQHATSRGVKVDAQRVVILLRDAARVVWGGLLGATYWGWLDIHTLWLDPSVRGLGYGAAMLRMAEKEALVRGCPHAVVDAAAFQSIGFFERQGYRAFATLDNRPAGHQTLFLRKALPTRRVP